MMFINTTWVETAHYTTKLMGKYVDSCVNLNKKQFIWYHFINFSIERKYNVIKIHTIIYYIFQHIHIIHSLSLFWSFLNCVHSSMIIEKMKTLQIHVAVNIGIVFFFVISGHNSCLNMSNNYFGNHQYSKVHQIHYLNLINVIDICTFPRYFQNA